MIHDWTSRIPVRTSARLAVPALLIVASTFTPTTRGGGPQFSHSSEPVRTSASRAAANRRGVPGDQLWVSRYNGPGNNADVALSLALSPQADVVYVTGTSYADRTSDDYATVAYTADSGDLLWLSRYDAHRRGEDIARAVGVSPDGTTVFVTGESYGGRIRGTDVATIAYDADSGREMWVKRYNSPTNEHDAAGHLEVSPDGQVIYVAGETGGDDLVIAYDALTGAQLWVATFDVGFDAVAGLARSPDGTRLYITGYSGLGDPYLSYDFTTVAYDAASGSQLWWAGYDGSGDDFASGLAVSPDGATVYATGASISGTFGPGQVATVAYDANSGQQLWVSRLGTQKGDDSGSAIGFSPDGSVVFVTGYSEGADRRLNYATIALDASTGARRWVARYDGPAGRDDVAFSLAVAPDGGSVYVTGYSEAPPYDQLDYATIAYDAGSGAEIWSARYDGPRHSNDEGTDVEVAFDGSRVFVAGDSTGQSSMQDYATIAYQA
jgi:WD40 repeat protein